MTRELGPELAARLDPGYPIGHPVITQPGHAWDGDGLGLAEQIDALRGQIGLAAEASGSNNWAVSGERSATGSPLIAGDPHLPPSMPGIWYQVDLQLGDRFARGASLPGVPGINMGQNNDVAFTFTNAMADVQDLFVERIDGDRYEFEDEWLAIEVLEEEIEVKGSAPSGSRSAAPTTGRSSTIASAPTTPSRWPCVGWRSTRPRSARPRSRSSSRRMGTSSRRCSQRTTRRSPT